MNIVTILHLLIILNFTHYKTDCQQLEASSHSHENGTTVTQCKSFIIFL